MLVKEVCEAIEKLAPLSLSEDWDNCGLIIGNHNNPVSRILLTLDVTTDALSMALNLGSEMIIAHHPIIFHPIRKLCDEPPINHIITRCIQNNLSIYAAHTNLDAAHGGVSDALATKLNLKIIGTISPIDKKKTTINYNEHDDNVKKYLTEFPDLNENVPVGFGRIAVPAEKIHAKPFLRLVNNNLQSTGCIINFDKDKTYRKLLIWGGSFDNGVIKNCLEENIDCIVAGEIKHNDLLALAELGIHAIAVGHDVTERTVLPRLKRYMELTVPACRIAVNNGLSYNNLVY